MSVSYTYPIFDIRRDAFPADASGQRMFAELQNFTQRLNEFMIEFVQMQERIRLLDGVNPPADNVGSTYIYVDETGGDLKVKFGDGTIKTLATDT